MGTRTRPGRLRVALGCIGAVVCALGVAACGSQAKPAAAQAATASTYTDLNALVAAAKKEGSLTIYAAPEYLTDLTKAFQKVYPWAKVVGSAVEPPQATAKFLAEFNAGLHQTDIVDLKEPELESFVKLGALAKVKVPSDAKVNPSLQDPNGYSHPLSAVPIALVYNTKLVPSGPANLADLTKPEWKGKLAIDDPSSGSDGGQLLASQRKAMGDTGWDTWLAGLSQNQPYVTDSASTSFEAVLRGDRAICVCAAHDYASSAAAGSLLGIDFYNQDGAGIIEAPTIAVVPAKAPHPAMAALFLNWVESPEGGQAFFIQSGRDPVVDVPGAHVSVPSTVKVAALFDVLGDYFKSPDSYNTEFKKYFQK